MTERVAEALRAEAVQAYLDRQMDKLSVVPLAHWRIAMRVALLGALQEGIRMAQDIMRDVEDRNPS